MSPENLPGYERQKQRQATSTDWMENADLWDEVFDAPNVTKLQLKVKWVNAHATDVEDMAPHIPAAIYQGNEVADKAAKAAANSHQVPMSDVKVVAAQFDKTRLILRRLVAVSCAEAIGPRGKKLTAREAKPR